MIKKINYFFLRLLYPRPNKIVKALKSETKSVKIEGLNYKIFKLHSARVYTDTIHNFAVIKKKELIEGPSYQIKDNNFSNIKNNISLKIGTPRKKIILKNSILSLLSGGGANKNYFHWLFDILPRIGIVKKIYNLNKIDFFLLPDISQDFQKQTLEILKIYNKSLSSIKYRHVQADEIFITSHPYIFSNDSHLDTQKIPRWICFWLKNNFLKYSSKRYKYKKIYINRRSTGNLENSRLIINNTEVKDYLEKLGFKSIFLEDFSFRDQISIFNNARIIVGLHGAGFANLVFCKKNTKVIEFKTKFTGKMYKNIAQKNNLIYDSISILTKNKNNRQQGEIKIPLNILQKKLKEKNITAG